MKFFDDLPDQCPPMDHMTSELENVYRMLRGIQPTETDWLSYARLGKTCAAGVSECRWASLSLLASRPAVEKLLKLPNFKRSTHAALLTIPANSGGHVSKKNHIDFWQDIAANMNTFVTAIEQVRSA